MKTLYFIIIYLLVACSGTALAQEIPNGDGDLLWERPLNGRTVNDAKFHPINGNIIAAVNHEIWEIDPKDGHTIRVFEGETGIKYEGWIDLSTDGNYIILSNGGGTHLKLYDYNQGKLSKELLMKPWSNVDFFPNSTKILFHQSKNIIVYDAINDSIIKKSDSLPYNTYFQYSRLSEDGRLIAIGNVTDNFGDRTFTMELWDAETLTKIKDFGSPGDIVEFRDVQISDDNQYVGFHSGGGELLTIILNISLGQLTKSYSNTNAFTFTNDCKNICKHSPLEQGNSSVTSIINLQTQDTLYEYKTPWKFLKFNKNNELLTCGWNAKEGATLKLMSSHWYEVGVNESKEPQATISPNPASDYIEVNVGAIHELPLQEIRIYDIFGKQVLSVETIHELSLQKINISPLPAGVYFVRVGDEKPMKFIKL